MPAKHFRRSFSMVTENDIKGCPKGGGLDIGEMSVKFRLNQKDAQRNSK